MKDDGRIIAIGDVHGCAETLKTLIAASVYLYPKQPQSTFFYDLLLTLMFIFLYYLYFKRMEMAKQNFNQNQDPGLQ